MKRWLLYFFAVALCVSLSPIVASSLPIANEIPIITVYENETVSEMTVEEYTLRAMLVSGENAQGEAAKKALAVAIRSEAIYLSVYGCKHENFDVCADGSCCLSLGSIEDAEEKHLEECVSATESTFGQAMSDGRNAAMALFTLCASHGTRDCEEFPYIVGVPSDTRCDIHITEKTFPNELGSGEAFIIYDGSQKCAFGILGNRLMDSDELTAMFSLPSAEFILKATDSEISVQSFGAGHGYGLCLCGASRMAENGKSFEEILSHYYPKLHLNNFYYN